ncbi:MAG: hypothetical protein KAI47_03775 [Deltaproteobacteria bacterium]|nr:hypothetical protein [Deltaproteobacteria bacterium]
MACVSRAPLGWTQNIVLAKGHAWVASGYFGMQVVDLDKAPVGDAL